ncbi:MAG: hypothetical protein KGO49_05040 [Gammaproteobacteria bacterium]|nr:hypothetical protein [Gammaproteobacteria bacterium]
MRKLNEQYRMFFRSFGLLLVGVLIGSVGYANDLAIYQPGNNGQVTLTMMLDTTGSMGDGSIPADYNVRCWPSSNPVAATVTNGQYIPAYSWRSCVSGGKTYYTRFTRLQQGMMDVLSSTTGGLDNVVMGLGNFSANGDGLTGQIIVPAAALGAPSATACTGTAVANGTANQRCKLAYAITQLYASGGTPTVNAYAEAAAYMLGTNTTGTVAYTNVPVAVDSVLVKSTTRQWAYLVCSQYNWSGSRCWDYSNSVWQTDPTPVSVSNSYYSCNNLLATDSVNQVQLCNGDTFTGTDSQYQSGTLPAAGWVAAATPGTGSTSPYAAYTVSSTGTLPDPSSIAVPVSTSSPCDRYGKFAQCVQQTIVTTTVYYSSTFQQVPVASGATDSGMANSLINNSTYPGIFPTGTTSLTPTTNYLSPLPNNNISCNGQGVYVLSDGQPNADGVPNAQALMQSALGSKGSAFTCPTGTTGVLQNNGAGYDWAAWNCIGEFSRALYDTTRNPSGKSLLTAFVGFGSSFTSLQQANNLTGIPLDTFNSCMLGSRTPDKGNDACTGWNSTNGSYGRGGYYNAQKASDVTGSVLGFIGTLSMANVAPLVTGSPTVPIDNLNPNGFQPFGYFQGISPNPTNPSVVTWSGNVKKYNVLKGALTDKNNKFVLNTDGSFVTGGTDPKGNLIPTTTELWNNLLVPQPVTSPAPNPSAEPDGGLVVDGTANNIVYPGAGVYSQITVPTAYNQPVGSNPPTAFRPLFSDIDLAGTGKSSANGSPLLSFQPAADATTNTNENDVLRMLNQSPYNGINPVRKRLAILNFLGYELPLNSATLPTTLTPPTKPYKALGATIHSAPVSLTYQGSIDANGKESGLKESLAFGSMDGALHLVDMMTNSALTDTGGKEQMVFVPNDETLGNPVNLQALKPGATNLASAPTSAMAPQTAIPTLKQLLPSQGFDGPLVVDSLYMASKSGSPGTTTLTATQMNLYGGMRMGGSSYYGLDLCNATTTGSACTLPSTSGFTPKLLFKINASVPGFDRLGQTWAKPVLANVRFGNNILRVMIFGGGYDFCYEDAFFYPTNTSLNATTGINGCLKPSGSQYAAGNAIYMVNAATGDLIWEASSVAPAVMPSTAAKFKSVPSMINSIVAPVGVVDRDADGLIDVVYFADLGGQIFRADFNNAVGTLKDNFNVNVTRLANFASSSLIAAGNVPRFYQAPVLTYETQVASPSSATPLNGSAAFELLTIASGDRSNPVDILTARDGGLGISRTNNNVYGIIDRDFVSPTLMTNPSQTKLTQDLTLANLLQNPQSTPSTTNLIATFVPVGGATSSTTAGWYRSVSSAGSDLSGASQVSGKTMGGMKVFEPSFAITNKLYVPVYDPEGIDVAAVSSCTPRVIGQSVNESFCLPYGACLLKDGSGHVDATAEKLQGGQPVTKTTNADGSITYSNNLIGAGIRGLSLGSDPASGKNVCPGFTIIGNQGGLGSWTCQRKLVPIRWYEKQPNPARVN